MPKIIDCLQFDKDASGLAADRTGEIFGQFVAFVDVAADRAFPAGFVFFFNVAGRIFR